MKKLLLMIILLLLIPSVSADDNEMFIPMTSLSLETNDPTNINYALGLLLLTVIGVLAYYTNISSIELPWLKIFFFGSSLFMSLIAIAFARLVLIESNAPQAIRDIFLAYYRTFVIVSYIAISLIFVIYLTYTLKGFSEVDKNAKQGKTVFG